MISSELIQLLKSSNREDRILGMRLMLETMSREEITKFLGYTNDMIGGRIKNSIFNMHGVTLNNKVLMFGSDFLEYAEYPSERWFFWTKNCKNYLIEF